MAETDSPLSRDESHPIPDVDVCDIHGERKDGGHDLVVVIASPHFGDTRSLERLKRKIAGYLSAAERLHDPASNAVIRIIVKIHRDSDSSVFGQLASWRHWIGEYGASLIIERLP